MPPPVRYPTPCLCVRGGIGRSAGAGHGTRRHDAHEFLARHRLDHDVARARHGQVAAALAAEAPGARTAVHLITQLNGILEAHHRVTVNDNFLTSPQSAGQHGAASFKEDSAGSLAGLADTAHPTNAAASHTAIAIHCHLHIPNIRQIRPRLGDQIAVSPGTKIHGHDLRGEIR